MSAVAMRSYVLRKLKRYALVAIGFSVVIAFCLLSPQLNYTSLKDGNPFSRSPLASGQNRLIWPDDNQMEDDRIFSQLSRLREFSRNRNFTTKPKVVLRKGNFNFNFLLWKDGNQHLLDSECPITDCWFTSNISQLSIADAVVISEFSWKDIKRLTPKPSHQIWIAQYLEPPHLRPLNSRALGNLINWTASYRRDSTIVIPYGKWSPISGERRHLKVPNSNEKSTPTSCSGKCCTRPGNNDCKISGQGFSSKGSEIVCRNANCSEVETNCTNCPEVKLEIALDVSQPLTHSAINFAKGRTKLIAMFVSSCEDSNGRRRFAWELSKYIDVDVYGDCGGFLSCPKSKKDSCFEMLKRDYKFYLAFENSNCVWYMTEKLHVNALQNDVVPVVMGARAEDYAASAPPGSYIHVDDFDSPQDLAKYLKLLDSNDTLYNEYFRYKGHYKYIDIHDTWYWCRLCGLLHLSDHEQYINWYDDFDKRTRESCSTRANGRDSLWKTWKEDGIEISKTDELTKIQHSLMK